MSKINCREINMCMFCENWLGKKPIIDLITGDVKAKPGKGDVMEDNRVLKNPVKAASAVRGLKEKNDLAYIQNAEAQDYSEGRQFSARDAQENNVLQEAQVSQTNVNVRFKIDEKTLKLGAKTILAAGGAVAGHSILGPVATGIGFAIGGPALGVMGWTIGNVAGFAGGGILGKKFSDKVVGDIAGEETDLNDERGIYADLKHQKNKWTGR